MLYIQHPTHIQHVLLTSHSAPQVPSALSHSYSHSVFCVCFYLLFVFFPASLHLSLLDTFVYFIFHPRFISLSFSVYLTLRFSLFQREKSSTPGMKPGTPMSQESNTPGPSGPPQFRPVPAKSGVDPLGKNILQACFNSPKTLNLYFIIKRLK